ncbi:MAG TPA: MlaD family protein [Cyclobacteriaceae bacterium]|jgi:phospholipid/cholesterol/gamma-HCH transport system substrate-binding protein|nr:MlaD family protein [Cyclobacteriaceae bacterium]
MDEEEVKQRVKLGAFVAGGSLLFLIAVFFIGNASNFFTRTFVISAVFKTVEGLKEGDKVWLSGVQIGTVKTVRIVRVGEVVVSLSLKEKQNEFIRKDASASIGSDGLIGNKIVLIQPGNSSSIIKEDDTLAAVSPADTQQIINIAKQVGENTRSITIDLKMISGKIKDGQGVIGELLNDGLFSQELRRTLTNIKMTGENTARASSELSAVIHELKYGNGIMPVLLSDTSYLTDFKKTLDNMKEASSNVSLFSKSLRSIAKKMNDKDNSIGVLLADTAFAHKLKRIASNSESATYKLNQDMEALQHNFLTRGYFRKLEKKERKEKEKLAKEQENELKSKKNK